MLYALRRSSRFLQPLLMTGLLMALLWGGIFMDLQSAEENLQAKTESDLSNLALAFSKQIESSIKLIDLTLVDLRDHWKNDPGRFSATVHSRQSHLERELAFQVSVIGPDGTLAFTSLEPASKPLDLSDREHFKAHQNRGTDELFISKPLLGRVSKRWSIQFTRPIFDGAGHFEGVVVLSVDPEYFYQFYRSINLPPRSSITLVRHDGEVLSRFPEPSQALGQKLSSAPFLASFAPDAGVYTRRSKIDGIERFYAWRKVDRQNAVVVVGHAAQELVAPYHEQRSRLTLAGIGLSVLLVLVAYLRWKSAQQQQTAARRLEANEERWRLALEASGDGVWDWNIANNQVIYSARWKTMLGYEPEDIGISREEWNKRVHPEDMAACLHAIEQHMMGRVPVYFSEFRMQARDGQWKWIMDRGMVISRSPNGTPLRMVGTHTDISARKQLEEELRTFATTDALTGLSNRRHFLERLELELQRFQRYTASKAGVLMIDIDFFKRINDHHGHAVGDAALKHFSNMLLGNMRKTDVAGRMGGEEFALLLIEINHEQALQFSNRLCSRLRHSPLVVGPHRITMSVSIGLSMLDPADTGCEQVLHRADQALYQAKHDGRDRVAMYAPALQAAPETEPA